jgi:hypothetical protein
MILQWLIFFSGFYLWILGSCVDVNNRTAFVIIKIIPVMIGILLMFVMILPKEVLYKFSF